MKSIGDQNKRLKIVREQLGMNQKEFGKEIGLEQGSLSDIERGKNDVSERIRLILYSKFGVSPLWFESGKLPIAHDEPVFNSKKQKQYISLPKISSTVQEAASTYMPKPTKQNSITFYEVGFLAGTTMTGFSDTDEKPETQQIVLPEFNDCDFAAKVYGDSMSGKFEHGEICFGKTLPQNFWDYVRFGEPYYIVTVEEKQLAYVRKSNDKTKYLIRKHNTYYEDFEIKIDDIRKMVHVKGKGKFERTSF